MKFTYATKNYFTPAIVVFISLIMVGCVATTPVSYYQVSENFNSFKIQKVGILVVRMWNYFPSSTIPLNLETDFSNRNPDYGWHGAISDATLNVYVEDDNRLKESFPFYPATTEGPIRYLTDHYQFQFYKNFSADIYKMLEETFGEKGFETIDIAGLSKKWPKPISESTLSEIILQSQDAVDSIAIFQYLDIGDSSSRVGAVSADRQGFIDFNYSLYMFDTKTKMQILSYSKDFTAAAAIALSQDPEIINDPLNQDKIKRYKKSFGGWNTYFIINELPDQIITEKLMSYVKDGFHAQDKNLGDMKWTGLSSVIPDK